MRLSPPVEAAQIGMREQFQLVPAIPVSLFVTAPKWLETAVPWLVLPGCDGRPAGSFVPSAKFQPMTSSTNPSWLMSSAELIQRLGLRSSCFQYVPPSTAAIGTECEPLPIDHPLNAL